MKKPPECRGCPFFHRAGHPKGSALHGSRYDCWCCRYSRAAPQAIGQCRNEGGPPKVAKPA